MTDFSIFSPKQMRVLTWWMPGRKTARRDALICDGAVRSGKSLCMLLSFTAWAFACFDNQSFALCGKTIASLRRNLITPLSEQLHRLGFSCEDKVSKNVLELRRGGRCNRFYLFGGRDESSAALIQGMTLAGVLFDEVALMPRSFVEQALARCSVEGSKFWFNCNPEYPQHWFYREWIMQREAKNTYYLHFTMEDNPSLSESMKKRYKSLYKGAFYDRFILGKWSSAVGLIYPGEGEKAENTYLPEKVERYCVSGDYGTVNPTSLGLWGLSGGCWYRLKEYYFDSRRQGSCRTDEEHYLGLERLTEGVTVDKVILDPSAASFAEVIRRHGKFHVVPAKNDVVDGIRRVSDALRNGKIRICRTCRDAIREFGCYRWDGSGGKDQPCKENDHAMDDIRYFVSTVLRESGEEFFALSCDREEGRAVREFENE